MVEKLPTLRQILAKAYRDNGDIGAANYIEGGSDLLPDTQVHLLAIQDALNFVPGTTRAPADLRSALEAETIREAAEYASELREIAGMLAQSPDGPLRWKQYRLVAVADFLNALTALAPTTGDQS